jgi:RND superfamily putative drug exporter
MLIITRSVVAAAVIVGTVLLSLGVVRVVGADLAAPHRHPLHWMVLAMSVIILLAVGSDYNLLLVARFKEEIHAGLNTGIIRAMGGTVRWSPRPAGVRVHHDVHGGQRAAVIAQVGTTIGLGLLFDTLVSGRS